MDRFTTCLPFTLAQECPVPNNLTDPRNFSDDPGDPGGKTFCGIIQSEYNSYRHRHGLPMRDVRQLTEIEGLDIYRNNYWLPHCDVLPPGLDLQFFDECVNTGAAEAVKVLQVALGITADGVWGPKTMAAVQGITNLAAVVRAYTARREAVYRQMRGFARFGKDWELRASEIGADALKMVPA